jgi:FdhD protein
MQPANLPVQYVQYTPDRWSTIRAEVIVETPVSLTINGADWLTFMCTPVDLEAMAVGFLFNEGVIDSMGAVASVRLCAAGDNVDVWLNHAAIKPDKWRRTSGCTGGVTHLDTDSPIPPVPDGSVLSADSIGSLINCLFESQLLYQQSGGVHTSALSDGKDLLVVTEDIGRHNTLDKLAGRCLMEGIPTTGLVILTTGRISSEMLQKAARMGVAILISRTSPSSLSIQLAQRLGVTLIGYARRNRFNIYANPQRIISKKLPAGDAFPELVGIAQTGST